MQMSLSYFLNLCPIKLWCLNMKNAMVANLTCTNATGSQKLRLLVIGKSKAPLCFKNVLTFPCDYVSQNCAGMKGDIFMY